jgi:phosphate uptake regulator
MRAESGAACSSVARRLASKRSTATSGSTWSHLARVGDLALESTEQFLDFGSRVESQLVEALENLRRQIQT